MPWQCSLYLIGLLVARAASAATDVVAEQVVPNALAPTALDGLFKKVAFIKTHATGSSTMLAILFRYCELHSKKCAEFPSDLGLHQNVDRMPLAGCAIRQKGKVDIWPYHVYFEPDLFEEMMPGAVTISLFRDPLSRVLSSFGHEQDPDIIADAAWKIASNSEATPSCGTAGDRMVSQIPLSTFPKLDFVMLTEQYDLSLVLLARKLGWTLSDLLYHRLKDNRVMRDRKAVEFDKLKTLIELPQERATETGRAFLKACIGEDETELYRRAKEKFAQQWDALTQQEQTEVELDVSRLRSGLAALETCCEKPFEDDFCTILLKDRTDWTNHLKSGERFPASTWHSQCRMTAIQAMLSV